MGLRASTNKKKVIDNKQNNMDKTWIQLFRLYILYFSIVFK